MVTVRIDWREPRSGKSMNERFVLSGSVDDYRIRTLNIRHGSFTCRLFVFLSCRALTKNNRRPAPTGSSGGISRSFI
jgi:hypothetical protein